MKLTSQIVASLLPLAAMAQAELPLGIVDAGGHHTAGSQVDSRRVMFFEPALRVTPERDRVREKLMVLTAQAGPAAVTSPVAPTAPVVAAPPAARPAAPASAAAARPSASASSAKATAASAVALPPRPRDAAFFEEQEYRLRALKRLRDLGLISDEEYVQKRREVLEQL